MLMPCYPVVCHSMTQLAPNWADSEMLDIPEASRVKATFGDKSIKI